MEKLSTLLNKYFAKQDIGGLPSINDLRDKEFNGEPLTKKEIQALANFDRYRISELNAQTDDVAFHKRYRELQIEANMSDYEEFLKEKYFI